MITCAPSSAYSGIPADVTADGDSAQVQITHFTDYTVLGGLTSQKLSRVFRDAYEGGATCEDAMDVVMGYLEGRSA